MQFFTEDRSHFLSPTEEMQNLLKGCFLQKIAQLFSRNILV